MTIFFELCIFSDETKPAESSNMKHILSTNSIFSELLHLTSCQWIKHHKELQVDLVADVFLGSGKEEMLDPNRGLPKILCSEPSV